MNKKTITMLSLVLLLFVIIGVSQFFGKANQKNTITPNQSNSMENTVPSQENGNIGTVPNVITEEPDENIYLTEWDVTTSDGVYMLRGKIVEFLDRKTGMFDAAIKDGLCTTEQVSEGSCLNNLFYIRKTGNIAAIPISFGASISLVDYNQEETFDANLTKKNMLEDFYNTKNTARASSYLLDVGLEKGTVISIEERYIP